MLSKKKSKRYPTLDFLLKLIKNVNRNTEFIKAKA